MVQDLSYVAKGRGQRAVRQSRCRRLGRREEIDRSRFAAFGVVLTALAVAIQPKCYGATQTPSDCLAISSNYYRKLRYPLAG